MQFENYDDRREAIRAASIELGNAYGHLKFKEQMFRETCASFVRGEPEQGPKVDPNNATVECKEIKAPKEEKPKAKPKAKAKAKAKPKKDEMEVNTEEAEAESKDEGMEVNTEDSKLTSACPISSVDELRNYLTERYQELGGTQEVRAKLIEALTEATGKNQAADVTEDQFPLAYEAISKVEK